MTDALEDLRRMTRAVEWERRALEAEERLSAAEGNLDSLRRRVKVLEGEREALRLALMAARR